MFPTVRARRPNVLDMHLAVPVVGRGDLATVGTHADQHHVAPKGAAA